MAITVPRFICSETPVVIDSPEGKLFWYQNAESGFMSVSSTGHFQTIRIDEEELKEIWPDAPRALLDLHYEKLIPTKAGKGKITFVINGRTTTVPVIVEHSAVIDSVSYPEIDVSKVLENKEAYEGKKISCKGTALTMENELVFAKQKDNYFAFYDNGTKMYEENAYVVYGEIERYVEYRTETGLRYECPVIATEKIE